MEHLESLRERQLELEQEAVMLGKTRYNAERMPWQQKARTEDAEADTVPGERMLRMALESTAFLIIKFVEEAGAGKAGRKHSALPYVVRVDPLQAAYLTARCAINGAARNKALQSVALSIAAAIEDHLNIQKLAKEKPGLYRKVSDQLKSSTSATHRLGVYRHVIDKYGDKPLSWSTQERVLLGTKLLELFISATDMVKIERVTEGRHNTPQRVQFAEEWAESLAKGHEQCALLSPIHLPMVHPPRPWRHPYAGGYLSDAIRVRLVQTRSRAYLDELGSLDLTPVLDAVNTIQSTPWRINRRVLEVMGEVWAAGGCGIMPPADNEALPARPEGVPKDVSAQNLTVDQQEQLKEWKARASKVHARNAELRSERAQVEQKLWVARRFVDETAIYFPHYLDFRGRVYPFANYLNPQGDDQAKGLLEFSEGKPLGEDGAYWLAVHIANLFGVDKVSFDERVAWTQEHTEEILDSALDPLDGARFWLTADKPFQALAACFEWASYQYNGDAHVSHLPVAMDGSCSGLQHFSALLRDEVGGAAVNLVPQDQPADVYSTVSERAQVASDVSDTGYADTWRGKVCRKVAKQPTMTLCYSATKYGMQLQIEGALRKLDDEHGGRYLNGDTENHHAAVYMADIVWHAIGDVVVAARRAMDWLQRVATVMAEGDMPVRWTTPMGLPILQAYKEAKGERLKVHVDGVPVKLMVSVEGQKIHARRQASGIAPNFVHSLDSAHLMRTATLAADNGITSLCVIHDSFATHACNTSLLNAVIREAFVQQYTPNLLEQFRDEVVEQIRARRPELVDKVPPLPPMGNLDLAAVKNSDFFFA